MSSDPPVPESTVVASAGPPVASDSPAPSAPTAPQTTLVAPNAAPPPAASVTADQAPPQPVPAPLFSTGRAFDEETRYLLRRRLLVTHGTIGVAAGVVTLVGLLGGGGLPAEAGLGRWAVGLPLLAFGQALAGVIFLVRRPDAPLPVLRFVEATQVATCAAAGGAARFLALAAPPVETPDPRYERLLYQFDAVLTNYSFVFAIVLYGVLIPNTRRRSLTVAGLLALVPLAATAAAAAVNTGVRPHLSVIMPVTAVPLFMALVVAVFSAARVAELRREVFEARREAQQVGPYTLKKPLGAGGMGEVFLAEHRLLKRPCAVKFIRAEMAANPAVAARFEREVRAVTGLTHFNTVRVYDYGRADDGSFYYVMEYLDGPTLDALVKRVGPLPPGRAVHLLRQLCGALAEAHGAGLVHRDVKPSNVIVATLGGQRDVAKVLDFGLVHDAGSTDGRLTQTGAVMGTPAYMCPEQAAGEANIDGRGDLYSLGGVAFFALTGRPPFEGTAAWQVISAHLTKTPPRADEVNPAVPADLAGVVARCLAKDPAERLQTAAELDAALAACGCAGDWSAAEAARWWAAHEAGDR